MSQPLSKVPNHPTQDGTTKRTSINISNKYCLLLAVIATLTLLLTTFFLITNAPSSQKQPSRMLESNSSKDDYLVRKAEYGVARQAFLKDKQQYQGLNLLESNLAYNEPISADLQRIQDEEYSRLDNIYHFANMKKELPFCVIVQGLNFSTPHLFELTLNSIFGQNYSNYKAVLFNFGEEGSTLIVEYFRLNRVKKENYVFIKHKENHGILENILAASQGHCQKGSISLNLVGNGELIGRNVLKTFNAVYQANKIGVAYSNFYNYNQGGPIIQGFNTAHSQEDLVNLRRLRFAISSPVTYLTEHALKIQLEDLKDSNGHFLDLAFEQALFFPIIDIACRAVLKVDGFHLAVKDGISTFEQFKKSLEVRSEPSVIARSKKHYNCDESFNNAIRHKSVIYHKQYLIDEPALKTISEKRVQKEGVVSPAKSPMNFETTPEIVQKLGEYLYKDEKVLKERASFQKERIDLINLQSREDNKKMIKYNLRLGGGLDKNQENIEEFESFDAESRHKVSKHPDEMPFCIVVQSLPFEPPYQFRFEHILNSIFNQNYTNLFAVIINQDLRLDEPIRKYLLRLKVNKQRYVYLENYDERSPAELLHNALTSYCSYDSYSILLDGTGELLGKNTLKVFNSNFQELNAGVLYSNNFIFDQEKASLHYSNTEKYSQDEKDQNRYRNSGKKYGHLLAFRTELYFNIDVEDFQDVNGHFIDGSLENHVILSVLELSCQQVHKIIGVHYITNKDVQQYHRGREMSFAIENKKKYQCIKEKKLTLRDSTVDIAALSELKIVSERHIQKEGTMPAMPVPEMDFLMTDDQQLTIEEYLYPSERRIIKQRTRYQLERENFLKTKNNEDSRQLIQFNLKLADHVNDNQGKLEAEDYASIQTVYNSIDTAPEVPICVVVDRFNFQLPFKFEYALNSIFNQNYSNSFVVVAGDGSKVGNALLRKYLSFYRIPKDRFVYLENKEKRGTLEVTLSAVNNYCSKDSLVVNVGGEDELIGRIVFKTYSAAYQEGQPLFIYSNVYYYSQGASLDYGRSDHYTEAQIQDNAFRNIQPKYDYPLFYHSELLRKIDPNDLKFTDNTYYTAAFQQAISVPMLELACGRIRKILGVHYLYNKDHKAKIDRMLEGRELSKLASSKKYSCVKEVKPKKQLIIPKETVKVSQEPVE